MKNRHINIRSNNDLIKVLNEGVNYNSIDVSYCDITISQVNELLNLTQDLNINNSQVTIDKLLMLNACSLYFMDCELILESKEENSFDIKVITQFVFPYIKFIRCKSEEGIVFNFKYNNFLRVMLTNSPCICEVNIEGSDIRALEIMECDNLKVTNIEYTEIGFFSSRFTNHEINFNRVGIPELCVDTDAKITKITNSYNTLIGGVLGRTLEFDVYGYKKVVTDCGCKNAILYLKIPKGAKIHCDNRSGKCRASEVITMYAMDEYGNITNTDDENIKYYPSIYSDLGIKYQINKVTKPNCFDESFIECSNGIHFFFHKEEAINY